MASPYFKLAELSTLRWQWLLIELILICAYILLVYVESFWKIQIICSNRVRFESGRLLVLLFDGLSCTYRRERFWRLGFENALLFFLGHFSLRSGLDLLFNKKWNEMTQDDKQFETRCEQKIQTQKKRTAPDSCGSLSKTDCCCSWTSPAWPTPCLLVRNSKFENLRRKNLKTNGVKN